MREPTSELWTARPRPVPEAELRLFCFPYAGGSAAEFWSWPPLLPAGVELVAIQLPGRANRIDEPPFTRLEPLVEALQDALHPHLRTPHAFFGHSMGALLAYELARCGGAGPERLYVAAHRAPQLPSRDPPLRDLADDELVRELRRLNGTPEQLLGQVELRELTLPRLRADFAVAETYEHALGPRLDIPVIALGGRDDRLVAVEELQAWAEVTSGPCQVRMVPGDHFFLRTSRDAVLGILGDDLREALLKPSEAAVP